MGSESQLLVRTKKLGFSASRLNTSLRISIIPIGKWYNLIPDASISGVFPGRDRFGSDYGWLLSKTAAIAVAGERRRARGQNGQ